MIFSLKFLWQEIINDHPHCPQIILHLKIVSELIFSVALISVSLGADAGERFKMTTSSRKERYFDYNFSFFLCIKEKSTAYPTEIVFQTVTKIWNIQYELEL